MKNIYFSLPTCFKNVDWDVKHHYQHNIGIDVFFFKIVPTCIFSPVAVHFIVICGHFNSFKLNKSIFNLMDVYIRYIDK